MYKNNNNNKKEKNRTSLMLQIQPFTDYAAFGMKEKVAFYGQISKLSDKPKGRFVYLTISIRVGFNILNVVSKKY